MLLVVMAAAVGVEQSLFAVLLLRLGRLCLELSSFSRPFRRDLRRWMRMEPLVFFGRHHHHYCLRSWMLALVQLVQTVLSLLATNAVADVCRTQRLESFQRASHKERGLS